MTEFHEVFIPDLDAWAVEVELDGGFGLLLTLFESRLFVIRYSPEGELQRFPADEIVSTIKRAEKALREIAAEQP